MTKPWSERITRENRSVTVYERTDRGGQVWLRWREPGEIKLRRERTKIDTLRDRRGRLLARELDKAREAARKKLDELLGQRKAKTSGPLTLRQGVELAFSDRGLWPGKDRYTRETRKRLETAIKILGGDDVLWEEVTPGMIRSIYRRIFAEHLKKGDAGGGHNRADKIITNFLTCASWLAGEFPREHFPRAPARWKKELREYWAKQGYPVDREAYRQEKRHEREEIDRLFRSRYDKRVDPRVRLSIVLGGRLRGGQVDRAMRSHYRPDEGIQMRRGRLGMLKIPYPSQRKKVPPLFLNWRERLELQRAMEYGYLSDLEAAYRAGEIEDYALFPSGKLRQGKAVVRPASMRPITTSRMIKLFHELEEIAGVQTVRYRGRHGLRRGFSDVDEKLDADDRVKDLLGGWKPGSQMRRAIYQHGERPELLKEAARVRARRISGEDRS